MSLRDWFRPATAKPAPSEPAPTGVVSTPALPDGDVFWEIRPSGEKERGLGELLTEPDNWTALRDARRDEAFAAIPDHYYRSHGMPAAKHRFRAEQFPAEVFFTPSAPRKKALPEYSAAFGEYVVSARVADVIEQFEPGRFAFIPFICRSVDGARVEHYCFFQAAEDHLAEAVRYERSGYRQQVAPSGHSYWSEIPMPTRPPLILDAAHVVGRHWMTTGMMGRPTHRLISDALRHALGDFLPKSLMLVEARAV